jgi:cytochrome b561
MADAEGYRGNGSGIALSSAADDAALVARRADRRHVVCQVCAIAQMPNGDPQKIGVLVAHRYLALVMVGFILLPLLAALYHQFVQRDRLLQRMWFGRRDSGPPVP